MKLSNGEWRKGKEKEVTQRAYACGENSRYPPFVYAMRHDLYCHCFPDIYACKSGSATLEAF